MYDLRLLRQISPYNHAKFLLGLPMNFLQPFSDFYSETRLFVVVVSDESKLVAPPKAKIRLFVLNDGANEVNDRTKVS